MLTRHPKTGIRIIQAIKIDSNLQTTEAGDVIVFDGLALIEFDEGRDQIFTATGVTLQKRLLVYLPLNTLDIDHTLDYTILINPNTLFTNTLFDSESTTRKYKISRIEKENGLMLKHDYVICNV